MIVLHPLIMSAFFSLLMDVPTCSEGEVRLIDEDSYPGIGRN